MSGIGMDKVSGVIAELVKEFNGKNVTAAPKSKASAAIKA
jgi:hypothetical protein